MPGGLRITRDVLVALTVREFLAIADEALS